MANQEHVDLLKKGLDVWNQWRIQHPEVTPDLRRADLSLTKLNGIDLSQAFLSFANLNGCGLSRADLSNADLSRTDLRNSDLHKADLSEAHLARAKLGGADLSRARFSRADLRYADLSGTDLGGADLSNAYLSNADLSEADLSRANLKEAYLSGANLSGSDLCATDLSHATLVEANLANANLTNCSVYGISAWNVQLEETKQFNLVITPPNQLTVTVDNLEVAQFIYLLLNNRKIRDVIDTITSKVVLILGRFTPERKAILDALREELRKQNYSPVLFDFEKPASRDLTATVSILAHLARFIIVDLTDPSSAPHEVATVIPQCVVPVQPLLLRDDTHPRYEYAMFEDLRRRHHWVLSTFRYQDTAELLASLQAQVITPAEQKAKELTQLK